MRRLLPVVLFAACSADDGVTALEAPTDAAPPPIGAGYLELGVTEVENGDTLQLRVEGAFAGDTVSFYVGRGYGSGPCLPNGICHEILSPTLIGTAQANAQGVAGLSLPTPPAPVGRTVGFEAMVERGNVASSSAEVRVIRAAGSRAPFRLGNWHQQDGTGSISPNAIIFQTVEVARAVQLDGFSFRASAPGGQFKMALYEDNGGQPGSMIDMARPAAVQSGQNNVRALRNVALSPGRYWVAVTFSTDVQTWHNTLQSEPEYIILQPFANALPQAYAAGNFYMSVGVAGSIVVH